MREPVPTTHPPSRASTPNTTATRFSIVSPPKNTERLRESRGPVIGWESEREFPGKLGIGPNIPGGPRWGHAEKEKWRISPTHEDARLAAERGRLSAALLLCHLLLELPIEAT